MGDGSLADPILGVEEGHDGVGAPSGKVSPGGREFGGQAGGCMPLEDELGRVSIPDSVVDVQDGLELGI